MIIFIKKKIKFKEAVEIWNKRKINVQMAIINILINNQASHSSNCNTFINYNFF
jgi:hypothetical protein